MRVEDYMALPWSVRTERRTDDGVYYVATVDELPGFSVLRDTVEELARELPVGLRCHLEGYLSQGEEPPAPAGLDLA